MGIVVDSGVIVAADRGKLDFEEFLRRYADEVIARSVIPVSELLRGVHRAVTDEQRERRGAFVESLIAGLVLVPLHVEIARLHAQVGSALSAVGKTIGAPDLLIAATALYRGYRIATRDARSFPNVPGLQVELI